MIAAAAALWSASSARAQQANVAFDASLYRGKVLYLDFWASWCAPCQLSFPYMDHLVASHDAAKFSLMAVNVDRSRVSADEFLNRFGARVPVVFDPHGQIAARYHIQAMPTSLFFGRDGRVRYVHNGFEPGQITTYDSQITELLHEL